LGEVGVGLPPTEAVDVELAHMCAERGCRAKTFSELGEKAVRNDGVAI
jgi:hypothetical protein